MSATRAHFETADNFHPYECDGPGKCAHCDRRIIVHTGDEGTSSYAHHPGECALCDPAYDGMPNEHVAAAGEPDWDEPNDAFNPSRDEPTRLALFDRKEQT